MERKGSGSEKKGSPWKVKKRKLRRKRDQKEKEYSG